MTLNRYEKVKQRTQQVLEEFIAEHGREPTVSEMSQAYNELLDKLRRAPRGPAKHPQGFAAMDPERLKELAAKGGRVSKKVKIEESS